MPFSGSAGQWLDKSLLQVGLRRDQVYVTNIAHERPPGNEFSAFMKPLHPMMPEWLLELKKDILEIRPNVVVALGNIPLRMTTGKTGITKYRGSILECAYAPGVKVIPTYHPAAILRQWSWNSVALADWRRIAKDSQFPELNLPQRRLVVNPPREQWLLIKEQLLSADKISFDIECSNPGGRWVVTCVGFATSALEGFTFPWNDFTEPLIREILESPVKKIAQNGQFDISFLRNFGISVKNFWFDTMLAQHCCYPEFDKGLDFLASIYTREPYYKDEGKTWRASGDVDTLYRYNCKDVTVTFECYEQLADQLTELGTWDIFRHEMSLVEPLMAMTATGIKIDVPTCIGLQEKYTKERIVLEAALKTAIGREINVMSPVQVSDLVFNQLKLPKRYNRKSGGLTTSEETLEELAAKHNNPILRTVIEIRRRRKLLSTYLDPKVDSDNRIRCEFKIAGTVTGRLSSSASIFGTGMNLQNIPEAARVMFVPDPGLVFYYADLSQAEARVVAWLAGDEQLMTLFNDPTRDVHTENASRIFEQAPDKIGKDSPLRYLAKRCVHALNYGMAERRFYEVINTDSPSTGVRITMDDAKFLVARYFSLYPTILEWQRSIVRQLSATRTLSNPFGRRRTFHGRWSEELFREAYSFIPQSTVADALDAAIVRIYHKVPGHTMLLQVHDAILGQVHPDNVASAIPLITDEMSAPISFPTGNLSIPTDVKIGCNWAPASDSNLAGLKKWSPGAKTP